MLEWIETHPGLAAWVQAIGTLVAVGAAASIAVWQAAGARKAARQVALERLQSDREAAGVVLSAVSNFVNAFASHIDDPPFLQSLPHVRTVDATLEVYRETLKSIRIAELQDRALCERLLVAQSQICQILEMLSSLRRYVEMGGTKHEDISARASVIRNAGAAIATAADEFRERLRHLQAP